MTGKHMVTQCEISGYGQEYSSCSICNDYLDKSRQHVRELQSAAADAGRCIVCDSAYCYGCDDEEGMW